MCNTYRWKALGEEDFVKYIQSVLSVAAICALLITPASLVARDQVNTIPQGTVVSVRMIDSISSDQNHAGEIFRASIADAIRIGNQTVVPRGANAYVKLVDAHSAGRVKGRSELELQLDRIVVGNHSYPVASNIIALRGKSESKKTAKNAGIGALAGGGLGALFGGGKGAAIGAGVGAAAGVATNAANKGEQVRIGSESLVRFRLSAPLRIRE
jgi:outer membrane lipoprotein SlyB